MDETISVVNERKNKLNKFLFSWIKDDYDKYFVYILIAAFILRIFVFIKTMNQPVWWDAADYLSAAIRWAGINPNLIDMWYYRRGFFWPLFESLFFITGIGEIGIRLSLVFFSTGIVAISYFLIRDMFNKKFAFLASILITFSWIFMFFSGRPLNNLPASFFLLTSVFFFWKGYVLKKGNKFIYLFGLFFAITCLTRMQYLISAIPLMLFAFVREKHKFLFNKHLWIAVGIFALMFIPQYYLGVGSSQTGEIGGLAKSASEIFIYFTNLPYILDANQKGYYTLFTLSPLYFIFIFGFLLFFLDTILGFDKIFKSDEIQKRFFILSWIFISFLFLGYIAPHLEQRYIIDTLPFLFLITVYPYSLLEKYFTGKFKISEKTFFLLVSFLLILLLIPNIIFGNNLVELKKTSYLEVKQAGLWIKENSNPKDIIISDSLPQITYYSERSTYPFSLNYRRDIKGQNESALLDFIRENKPRYMTLTSFETQYDWAIAFPQNHPDLVAPVKVYEQNGQPVFIIYEFKYN